MPLFSVLWVEWLGSWVSALTVGRHTALEKALSFNTGAHPAAFGKWSVALQMALTR